MLYAFQDISTVSVPRSGIARIRKRFLAPSASNQIRSLTQSAQTDIRPAQWAPDIVVTSFFCWIYIAI